MQLQEFSPGSGSNPAFGIEFDLQSA